MAKRAAAPAAFNYTQYNNSNTHRKEHHRRNGNERDGTFNAKKKTMFNYSKKRKKMSMQLKFHCFLPRQTGVWDEPQKSIHPLVETSLRSPLCSSQTFHNINNFLRSHFDYQVFLAGLCLESKQTRRDLQRLHVSPWPCAYKSNPITTENSLSCLRFFLSLCLIYLIC